MVAVSSGFYYRQCLIALQRDKAMHHLPPVLSLFCTLQMCKSFEVKMALHEKSEVIHLRTRMAYNDGNINTSGTFHRDFALHVHFSFDPRLFIVEDFTVSPFLLLLSSFKSVLLDDTSNLRNRAFTLSCSIVESCFGTPSSDISPMSVHRYCQILVKNPVPHKTGLLSCKARAGSAVGIRLMDVTMAWHHHWRREETGGVERHTAALSSSGKMRGAARYERLDTRAGFNVENAAT
jgi:hypothetical protein